MRTCEKTHPRLAFRIGLRQAPPRLWLALGAAASKCEHIAGVPLRPGTAESLHRLYLAKGIHATTAIEGNTLTEEEVRGRLDGKLELPRSKEYLAQEIDNIAAACHRIGESLRSETPSLTPDRIREFNRLVLQHLDLDADVVPGSIREHSVVGRVPGDRAVEREASRLRVVPQRL